MSYLDVPRLHFSGGFTAAPSTVNNTPQNYNPAQPVGDLAWNPNGNHTWAINAAVRTVCFQDGAPSTGDPIVGSSVTSPGYPGAAKLVDLDTEQQMVSQIFGMQLTIGQAGADSFTGAFETVCFNDIFVRVQGGKPDSMFSAYYQSVLKKVQWSATVASPFLQLLQKASPDELSVKFVVDGFDDAATLPGGGANPNFTHGRISGTIGPYFKDEPINFVIGRFLRPTQDTASLTNYAPCLVDKTRAKAIFDLGNSIPTTAPAGPPPDLGTLQAAIFPSDGSPIILGTYDYTEQTYLNTAGVQEFPLTSDQLTAMANNPVGVLQITSDGADPLVFLQENPTGACANAKQYVYRMNPGQSAKVHLITTIFGERAPNQTLDIAFNNSGLQGVPDIPVATPAGALSFPSQVTTDSDGAASFDITATDPGNPRKFIDGQIYGVGFSWSLDPNPDSNAFISIHVYDAYPIPASPTWWVDVRPLFEPYARIYPFMQSLVNLDDYAAISGAMPGIRKFLEMKESNLQFMPVTRDLSGDKLAVILKWMDNGLPEGPRLPGQP